MAIYIYIYTVTPNHLYPQSFWDLSCSCDSGSTSHKHPILPAVEDLYYAPDRDAPLRGLAYIIHGHLVQLVQQKNQPWLVPFKWGLTYDVYIYIYIHTYFSGFFHMVPLNQHIWNILKNWMSFPIAIGDPWARFLREWGPAHRYLARGLDNSGIPEEETKTTSGDPC